MSAGTIFVTFTNLTTNQKERIQLNHIERYTRHKDELNGDIVTALYVGGDCIFVSQSPEQIDKMLGESYITVKSEQ